MTVTPYNFQKPSPLGSALEQQFAAWLKAACAFATRQWHKELPVPLEIQCGSIDFDRAGRVLAGLPEGSFAYRVALQEQLTTLFVWPRPLILGIIGALQADASPTLPADRELTLVEESLFEFFLKEYLMPGFLETWSGRAPPQPVLGPQEINPRWTRLFAADESLVLTKFSLRGPFEALEWLWLLPKKGLLECLGRETEADNVGGVRQRLEGLVQALPVEITVKLGAVELHFSQLSRLRVGDVIVLDQRVNEPLTAQVAGREKLCGWPGRLGNRQALRIEEWKP